MEWGVSHVWLPKLNTVVQKHNSKTCALLDRCKLSHLARCVMRKRLVIVLYQRRKKAIRNLKDVLNISIALSSPASAVRLMHESI